jgi:hypothetical protein
VKDPRQVLRTLADGLAAVADELPTGRRLGPEDLADLIRRRCDLTVVLGAMTAAGDDPPDYPNPTVGSASQIDGALLVDQLAQGSVSWLSDVVVDPARHVCFVFSLALGNGSAVPQPSVTFALDLEGREVARFCLAKSSRQWVGDDAVFSFVPLRVDSSPFGRSFDVDEVVTRESTLADGYGVLVVDRSQVAPGRANQLTVRALGEHASRHWCRVGIAPPYYPAFYAEDHLGAVREAVRTRAPREYAGYQLLLGDLHGHSGESHLIDHLPEGVGADEPCGIGSREAMFSYARDLAGLDFFCLSEHDWQMDEADWASLQRLNDEFLSDRFVTVHGFEWTSQMFGHRNVYFGERPGSLFYSLDPRVPLGAFLADAPSPRDLWAHLRTEAVPAITVPHHMSAAQFPLDLADYSDTDFDRVAEIYSAWGDSFEHGQLVTSGAARIERLEFVRAIRDGHRVGFIASSDSHDGHPGNAQGTPGRPHLFHHLGSGRAGVFTTESSRGGIFGGLQDRRCFAATGDGVAVWTTLDEQPMGTTSGTKGPGRFELVVDSDSSLSTVTVYRNGVVSERIDVTGERHVEADWVEPGDSRSVFVKVVRSDGETAWSSPHWVED